MSCDTYLKGESVIRRLDPRVRIVAAFLFAILIAISKQLIIPTAGLFISTLIVLAADLPPAPTFRRIFHLNIFMLLIFLILPLSAAGEPLFSLGPLNWSIAGLRMAASIALKANAIVLSYTALLSTVEPVRLGHAMHRLLVPQKLVHLFLFTIRYVDVIHHEYDRLVNAMRVRCFRPRLNAHTLRTYGHLVGMLLVNSFDRSEKIVAAMKCRCFRGRFRIMDNFSAGGRDLIFAAVSIAILLALGFAEWL